MLFWCRKWPDETISYYEIAKITHQDSARSKSLLFYHILAEYTDTIRLMTVIFSSSLLEQHREIYSRNIKRDVEDLKMFVAFLQDQYPLVDSKDNELSNIAIGLVECHRVNDFNVVDIWQKHA